MNYYELFEIKPAPAVDHTFVSKKYFELQKKFHPDFFTRENDGEKEYALEMSSDVNDAYKTFQSRDKSLAYFLKTHGNLSDDEKYSLPPAFLAEMMEINEALADGGGDVQKSVADAVKRLDENIAPLMEKCSAGAPGSEDLKALKEYYFKKKYLNRILDRTAD